MENTSNALIIAGEVLIGILVLSFVAYIFIEFSTFSSNMHDNIAQAEITEFNSNFFILSNRSNITAQEIVTIINFAKQANDARELEWNDNSEYYIDVYVDNYKVFASDKFINSESDYKNNNKLFQILNTFMKKHNKTYFSCNVRVTKNRNGEIKETYSEDDIKIGTTNLVNEIYFHSIDENIISIPDSF